MKKKRQTRDEIIRDMRNAEAKRHWEARFYQNRELNGMMDLRDDEPDTDQPCDGFAATLFDHISEKP